MFASNRGFGSSPNFWASSQPAFGQFGKLESISAMPVYKHKSHEVLRWEDYQLGDKGGPLASATQSTGMAGFNFNSSTTTTQTNAISPSPTFGQSSANPFSSTTPNSNNPFALKKTSTFNPGFVGSSTSAVAPSMFNSSSSPFGVNSTSSAFGSSIFGNTQSSPLFNSSTPTNPQSDSAFGQNTSPFGQTGAFSQPSLFRPPLLSSSASLTAPSMSTPFQTAQPAQSSGTFSFSNFGQTPPGTQTPTQAFANTGIGKSEFGGQRGGSRVASYSSTFVEDSPAIQTEKLESFIQTPTQAFANTGIGQSEFGGQRGGSRVASYSATFVEDTPAIQTEKLESISAIPFYKDKSHEELRLEDYQLGSSASKNAQSGSEFGQNTFHFGQMAGFRPSSFFGSHSSGLVGSIFSSMASLTSNAPSLAILTGTVVVTVVVTRWISLRCGRA